MRNGRKLANRLAAHADLVHSIARPLASSWKPVLLYMLPDAKPKDFRPMQFNDVVLGVKSERSEVEADRVEHEW
jgi:hypothetical protein